MTYIKKMKYGLLAFFLPFAFMTGIMIAMKCAPFGNNSFMIVDALHQYLPFFSDYQNKLKSMDSLFYSWNGGLGYNFYSLWAYYLSSPMNLVIALVPKLTMISAINWLISIKFALCSLTAFIYFTHREGKQSLKNLAFGMCYAFSTYMTGYYWNVMWLEVMILLPIVLLGMDRLVAGQGVKVYILALFGCLWCNYYMSFMMCIFLVLWYFTYYFKSVKQFICRGVTFAVSSVVAALMAAIVLLPAYKGLMSTSSAELNIPDWTYYGDAVNLFATHLVGVTPSNMAVDDGLGNLYCGILPVILLLLYVVDTKIAWKEKLSKIVILVFMGVSFEIQILNYVWHGFHDQYGIPNRFAFLYIFLLLIMAYDQLTLMERHGIRKWKVAAASAVLLGAVGYLYYVRIYDELWIYGASAGLVIFYGILLCMRREVWREVIYIFVITEVLVNAVYGFHQSGQVEADYYFSDTEAVADITSRANPTIENRMELLSSKMLDESIWYTMDGVTMFGSTALGNTVDAMDQLGFYTGVNEYLYEGATPFTDMLLGVRSILVRDTDYMYRTHYEYMYNRNGVSLYENNNPTAIGYFMGSDATGWNDPSYDPFEVQNSLAKDAFGVDTLFENASVPDPVGYGCDVDIHMDGQCYVKNVDDSYAEASVCYTFNISQTEELYLHFDAGNVDNTVVSINGDEIENGRFDSQIVTVGMVNKGDKVTVELYLEDDNETGSITMRAATLNENNYEALYRRMKSARVHLTDSTTTSVSGDVLATEDGTVFFSIPYDEGWSIIVDGVKQEAKAFANGFLSVEVKEGQHEIELTYQPPGFSLGWKLSLLGWALFLAGLFLAKKKKIKKKKKTIILPGGKDDEEKDEKADGTDSVSCDAVQPGSNG